MRSKASDRTLRMLGDGSNTRLLIVSPFILLIGTVSTLREFHVRPLTRPCFVVRPSLQCDLHCSTLRVRDTPVLAWKRLTFSQFKLKPVQCIVYYGGTCLVVVDLLVAH